MLWLCKADCQAGPGWPWGPGFFHLTAQFSALASARTWKNKKMQYLQFWNTMVKQATWAKSISPTTGNPQSSAELLQY